MTDRPKPQSDHPMFKYSCLGDEIDDKYAFKGFTNIALVLLIIAALWLGVSVTTQAEELTCDHKTTPEVCTEVALQEKYGHPIQYVDLEMYDGLLMVQIQAHVPNYRPHANAAYALLYMQTKRRVLAKALLGGFVKGAQSFYVYTFNADGELIGWDKNTVAL